MYEINDPAASLGYVFYSYDKYVRETKAEKKEPVSFFKYVVGLF